jgi:hypothetical protein
MPDNGPVSELPSHSPTWPERPPSTIGWCGTEAPSLHDHSGSLPRTEPAEADGRHAPDWDGLPR